MTTRNRKSLSWGKTVGSILNRARLREAELAREIGVNRATAHRYLNGAHDPKPETIARIHAVVAKLTGSEDARAYLDAQARVDGLLDTNDDELLHYGLAAFELVVGIITPGFAHRFWGTVAALRPAARRMLLLRLYRVHREALFNAIDGRVSALSGFDALRSVFAKAGLNLEALLDDGEPDASQAARVNSGLRAAIRSTINTVAPDASAKERFTAEYAIMDSFSEYLHSHPCIKITPRPSGFTEQLRKKLRRRERANRPARPRFIDDTIPAGHRIEAIVPPRTVAYAKTRRSSRRQKGKP